ncbi:MAG: hypothetical protein V4530_04000 [Pseudomonadota bacterium]
MNSVSAYELADDARDIPAGKPVSEISQRVIILHCNSGEILRRGRHDAYQRQIWRG